MKTVSLFLVMALATFPILNCFGQKYQTYFQVYYGSYSMKQLKDFQKETSYLEEIEIPVIESFPAYPGYELSIGFNGTDRYSLFFYGGLASTGGRSYYSDYSGKIFNDFFLTGQYIGMIHEFKVNKGETFDFLLALRMGSTFTKMKMERFFSLENIVSVNEEHNFKATTFHYGPQLAIRKQIDFFQVRIESRYEFNSRSRLHLKDDKNQYLVNSHNDSVSPEWDGFRIALCLGVTF